MRKMLIISLMLLLAVSLSACNPEVTTADNENDWSGTETTETDCYSPYDASSYLGMNHVQVESILRDAGFTQISLNAVEDIDSNSEISDGTVELVTINGMHDFVSTMAFDADAEIIITYHNIPKIVAPVASAEAASLQYMDVGKMYYDAGFANIKTDEIYDAAPGTGFETELTADGLPIEAGQAVPFDSQISVIGHYSIPEYSVKIDFYFEMNQVFSQYDVVATLNGTQLATLEYGQRTTCELSLPAGTYKLEFANVQDNTITGDVSLDVRSQVSATYHISCHEDAVIMKETAINQEVAADELLMPFSSDHYLRKDYEAVVAALEDMGFTAVVATPTSDSYWAPSPINTVVGISIGSATAFKRDDHFPKSSPVVVYYHIADFAFEQTNIQVTEKDTFQIGYSLTSGDSLESLVFEIDNPEVLQRNEDGTYTALIPGTAVVTVSGGGHIYATCTVEVAEIIVPIETVVFAANELDVVVGSTFNLAYTTLPENANYTDMTVTISGSGLEQNEDASFYASEAGDTEIKFYQDERLLGSCTIHASIVDIKELILNEAASEIFIGDSIDLTFRLLPENATCKGITATSSDPKVAEVSFDERGEKIVSVRGISAGRATITITTPDGRKYTHTLTVKEISPTEIIVVNTRPDIRIEVGTPIHLTVTLKPHNTTDPKLTWTSSNSKVVKVNADGTVEAVGVGTATITAKHKSGVSATISFTVEPTLVKRIDFDTDQDLSADFVKGNKFTITATVFPQNATNQTVTFASSDETVVKVSNKGVVTAMGAGTATVTMASPDGPSKTLTVTVSPSPQKFRIKWSATLIDSNHVGNRWSKSFEVNDKAFASGSTITVFPDETFTVCLTIQDNDSNPDVDDYFESFTFSEELCKNGCTITDTVYVRENGGRYSGNRAEWRISITITPVN